MKDHIGDCVIDRHEALLTGAQFFFRLFLLRDVAGDAEKDIYSARRIVQGACVGFEPASAAFQTYDLKMESARFAAKNSLGQVSESRPVFRDNQGIHALISHLFERIRLELGDTDVLLYNAAMRPFGTLMDTKPSTFENTWRVSSFGAFLAAQQVVPAMLQRRRGVILFTGATAGVKPFPTSAAFGPAKFAMRGLAQSLARDLGPRGIHVAWINVDGSIDIPGRSRPQLKEEDMLKPDAIAETYWHLVHQDRSSWTMELEVRPFKEKF